jgi:hypothetical protein
MVVIRLADGRLLVPESALAPHGRVLGDAFVVVGPDDAGYEQLVAESVSEQEYEERRRSWREGDAQLRQEFLDFLARHGAAGGWHEHDDSS